MTLICALKCNNGIVIGSDSQASVQTAAGPIKHNIQKIHKIGKNTLFAASGTIGLIQKSKDIIESYSDILDGGLTNEVIGNIKNDVFLIVKEAKDKYQQYYNKTEGVPDIDILICGKDKTDKLRMWHISADTHDEFIDIVGVYCSGSADAFGYALTKSFMQSASNIESGKLIVYRVLLDAINSIGSGISGPIDVWYIENTCNIHHLSNMQIEGLFKKYMEWKKLEIDFLSKGVGTIGGDKNDNKT
jgi:20S proteasome alpha/beta subunit